jgi:hypothetical protein
VILFAAIIYCFTIMYNHSSYSLLSIKLQTHSGTDSLTLLWLYKHLNHSVSSDRFVHTRSLTDWNWLNSNSMYSAYIAVPTCFSYFWSPSRVFKSRKTQEVWWLDRYCAAERARRRWEAGLRSAVHSTQLGEVEGWGETVHYMEGSSKREKHTGTNFALPEHSVP